MSPEQNTSYPNPLSSGSRSVFGIGIFTCWYKFGDAMQNIEVIELCEFAGYALRNSYGALS
jgi:hypothetical protein